MTCGPLMAISPAWPGPTSRPSSSRSLNQVPGKGTQTSLMAGEFGSSLTLRGIGDLGKQAVVIPRQLCECSHNWEAAVELGALVEGALADTGVGGESAEDLAAVVRAVLVEEQVLVDQPAGLVVGVEPRAIDLPPALENDRLHLAPERLREAARLELALLVAIFELHKGTPTAPSVARHSST